MRTLVIIFLLFALYLQRGEIIRAFNPPPPPALPHDGKVTIYSTDWCKYCKMAKQFMDSKGIPYTDIDIEKSREGYDTYKSLGGNGIPLLVVNGYIIRGYDPDAIEQDYKQIATAQ